MAILTNRQRRVLHHFEDNTTMHGVGHIANSRRVMRAMWTLLLLISASLLMLQVYNLTVKFINRPVSTKLAVSYEAPINFPSVTICNLNPLKYDMLDIYIQNLKTQDKWREYKKKDFQFSKPINTSLNNYKNSRNYEYIEDPSEAELADAEEECFVIGCDEYNVTKPEVSKAEQFFRDKAEYIFLTLFDEKENETETTNTPSREYQREQDLMFAMNTISASQRKNLTFEMKDFLVDCFFLNRPCYEYDFVPIISARYGTCFLFNGGMNKTLDRTPLKNVSASGAENSLILTLFVYQDNYLPEISSLAGYKVIVHDSARPPIPEEEGILLMPGQLTALGVRKKVVERAEVPYGKCKHFTDAENERFNMYLDQFPYTQPNVPVCMRSCEQILVIRECGCYSLRLGFANARAFKEVRGNQSYIPACSRSEAECARRIATAVARGDSRCKSDFCRFQACEHVMFDFGHSHSFWPANNSFTQFVRQLKRRSNDQMGAWNTAMKNVSQRSYVSDNFLKVKVYLSDLTVVHLKTEASYKLLDLLSDFGGNAGLWLGLSVFTGFELCVFVFDMISAMCKTEDEEEGQEERGAGTTTHNEQSTTKV